MLQDGWYQGSGPFYSILVVQGVSGVAQGGVLGEMPVRLRYGEFGEADRGTVYNVELIYSVNDQTHVEHGTVSRQGSLLSRKSAMGVHDYQKISEEEAKKVLDDGDPMDAPPTPYKIQPDKQGCLLWFAGPSGTGKSTCAQLLARDHGYVYYEGDCFQSCRNPYIPVQVQDPSMAQMQQRPLRGQGLEGRREVIARVMKEYVEASKGDYEEDPFKEYFHLLCRDIRREKERIGGDWAVAHLVLTRDMRDMIR